MTTVDANDIARGLRELGLCNGDVVLLHSSLASFGHVKGGAPAVVHAFLDVLGQEGTLVVPIFEPNLGIVTEVVRDDPRSVQSVHPLAGVAAIGAKAEAICADHWKAETAHGPGTPYVRIAELGGYVCLAGVDQDRNTTLHTVEALLRLPYLATETQTFETPEGQRTRTWRCVPGPHRDFIGLDRKLQERGIIRMGRIGDSVIRLMRSRDLVRAALDIGLGAQDFVLCRNPACADCVAQRAALRRHRFREVPFTVVAGSGLAGRYVPEMIERLQACGIEALELDFVQGAAAHILPQAVFAKAVQELRAAGIDPVALRCWSVPNAFNDVLDRAAENGIPAVILPISPAVREHAAACARRGIELIVFNVAEGSEATSRLLVQLQASGVPIAFAFNGPNFALAGERPFLESYKHKLRRFVRQLDVEDALFEGAMQPLACGNAEIKEMISILRCGSFNGRMTLTSRNRAVARLEQTLSQFERLLEEM
jgi:aminoglycoside 3-N-acetyltransferase